jgi:hypothetical protein
MKQQRWMPASRLGSNGPLPFSSSSSCLGEKRLGSGTMSFQGGASSTRRAPKGKIKAPKKVRPTVSGEKAAVGNTYLLCHV